MAGPVLTIRQATTTDLVGILECLGLAFAPYRERYTPEAFADTVLNSETIAIRLQTMTVFVALSGDAIVGTIGCQVIDRGEGHLRGMAVVPQWQGSSVARLLLRAAEAELTLRNCRRVTLDTTEPLQQAIRFYEKCGYRSTGKVSDFFGMPLFEYAKRLDRA